MKDFSEILEELFVLKLRLLMKSEPTGHCRITIVDNTTNKSYSRIIPRGAENKQIIDCIRECKEKIIKKLNKPKDD